MGHLQLTSIRIYPVKSLAGVEVPCAEVERRGLRGDRRFMVVDAADGTFITQREVPRMALVSSSTTDDGGILLRATGMPDVRARIPQSAGNCAISVRVWRSTCDAVAVGANVDQWLSQFLGRDCRLVYMSEGERRAINPQFAVRDDDHVSFADGYPCMLIGQSSLDDLNARLATKLPMNRFRPSLVVSGAEPFAEDGWKRVRIGEVEFDVVKPCERCKVTTIEQSTGEPSGSEPLRTLATYRRFGERILFGQNLIPEAPGTLRVGDAVEVLETKEPATEW